VGAPERLSLSTPKGPVSALVHAAAGEPRGGVILAPGAGATLDQPFLVKLAEELAAAGYLAARFNFPYRERGQARPDQPAVLLATWASAVAAIRERVGRLPLAVGGRSMGGRIASMMAAEGEAVDGLLLLAYPLNSPSGRGEPRTAHLPAIRVPALFVSGTRDQLAPIEDLRAAVRLVPDAELVELPGADHGFRALKGASPGTAETERNARAAVLEWLGRKLPA